MEYSDKGGDFPVNFAAVFSFLHPMLSVLITSGLVLWILHKEYSVYVKDERKFQLDKNKGIEG